MALFRKPLKKSGSSFVFRISPSDVMNFRLKRDSLYELRVKEVKNENHNGTDANSE